MSKQDTTKKPTAVDLEGAKELDRQLSDALSRKDLDAAMKCFWNDPDLVVVLNGNVFRGPEAARAALKALFDQNESIRVDVNEVSHVPSGDGVLGVGTATYNLKPLGGPPRLMVERWSDLRRKIGGRWVMVLDHTTHLPE
jgi:ketosteroid isomerase-like protein